jgi:heat shock protein HtpX
MTIYGQISHNKIRTVFLLLIFVVFFSFVFFLIGRIIGDSTGYLLLGLIFSVLSGIGSYFYSDKIILFMSGAKPADKKKYFDFYTVTENLAIASGIAMPKIYVIEDPSPNAFATGRNPSRAVICATTGLIDKLDRAELEGVIAHELSHVKNYDILLSSLVSILVGTLVFVTDWITRSWFWGGLRRNDDNRQVAPLFLILYLLVIIITPLVVTLIQLAISRKREYLADASGVLITRNPDGLASALRKISTDPQPLRRVSGATAHLFIVNPLRGKKFTSWIAGLFSTHPPIAERIKILANM